MTNTIWKQIYTSQASFPIFLNAENQWQHSPAIQEAVSLSMVLWTGNYKREKQLWDTSNIKIIQMYLSIQNRETTFQNSKSLKKHLMKLLSSHKELWCDWWNKISVVSTN